MRFGDWRVISANLLVSVVAKGRTVKRVAFVVEGVVGDVGRLLEKLAG